MQEKGDRLEEVFRMKSLMFYGSVILTFLGSHLPLIWPKAMEAGISPLNLNLNLCT